MTITAEHMTMVGGLAAFLYTVGNLRHRKLREKYSLFWLALAGGLLLLGIFPQLLMGGARLVHLSYSSFVLYIALGVIYLFSFSVSISLTRLHRRNIDLCQTVAIQNERIARLEAKLGEHGGA